MKPSKANLKKYSDEELKEFILLCIEVLKEREDSKLNNQGLIK